MDLNQGEIMVNNEDNGRVQVSLGRVAKRSHGVTVESLLLNVPICMIATQVATGCLIWYRSCLIREMAAPQGRRIAKLSPEKTKIERYALMSVLV